MNFYKFLNQFNTSKRISKFLFIMLKYDSESVALCKYDDVQKLQDIYVKEIFII